MRSLAELANEYERWADEDEAVASKIMSNVGNFPDGRERRLCEASILAAQAEFLRRQAARLRASRVAIISGTKEGVITT